MLDVVRTIARMGATAGEGKMGEVVRRVVEGTDEEGYWREVR